MRASAGTELIKREDDVITGIMLEHNHCSEHEWGVKALRMTCGGMNEDTAKEKQVCAFSRISIQVKPEDLIWYEEKGMVIMGVDRNIRFISQRDEKFYKAHKLKEGDPQAKIWAASSYELGTPKKLTAKDKADKWPPRQTLSAWDESSFGISSREPEVIAFLKDLKEAMLSGDAVLHISGTSNPFKPVSGLVLAITSRVPKEQKDGFEQTWRERYDLEDAAKKIGIKAKLEKAGLKWFSLEPRWVGDMRERIVDHDDKTGQAVTASVTTKYPVMFFLNPYQQDKYNSLWCTVEDLEDWIKGEGFIIKRKS